MANGDDWGNYAAIAAAAAALGGTAASGFTGNQRVQATSTGNVVFPPETQGLIRDVEFPVLGGNLGEQTNMFSPFMGSFGQNQGFLSGQYGKAPGLAMAAARKGAGQAGIGDLGPVFEGVRGLSPELINALQQLVMARGAGLQSIVPAGFGPFLAPSSFSQAQGAPPDPFTTGFGLAGSLGSIGKAYFNSGGG